MISNKGDAGPEGFFRNVDIAFLIHELKDPIAVIETGARTLLEKQDTFGTLNGRQERTVRRMLRNTRKARDMLYSLLEVGRSEACSFDCRPFNPVETAYAVLCDCLELKLPAIADELQRLPDISAAVARLNASDIRFSFAPDAMGLEMNQDLAKYRQIVGNLIKNALHFRRRRIQIHLAADDGVLRVQVVDDGPGVEAKHCEAIFERYAQSNGCAAASRQGHGLGLAGARVMARHLGGDIVLTCDPDSGTMFQLSLPLDFAGG